MNANLIGDGSVSDTEFGYLNGVTLGIQTQINGKASTSDLTNGLASKQASIPGTAPSNFNKLVTTADTDLEVPAISGNGGKVLALNSGATALEWTAASSGGGGSSSTVSFFAYGVGGWFTSLATQDTIVLGATQHNLGSGYSTSTGKFTAPSAGVYHFDTNFMVKHTTTSGAIYAVIDGNPLGSGGAWWNSAVQAQAVTPPSSNDESISMSWNYYMTANQTMEIRAGSSATDYYASFSFFSGFKL